MKRVEYQTYCRMIGSAHDFPSVAVIVDVAAPGQGFKADAHSTFSRAVAKLTKVGGGAIDAAERFRRYIAANHQLIAAKLLHQVKFSLGTIESTQPLRF